MKRVRKQKQRRRLAFFLLIVILIGGLAIWLFNRDEAEEEYQPYVSALNTSIQLASVPVAGLVDTHLLELVNFRHAISREPDRFILETAFPDIPAQNADLLLHVRARAAVLDWFRAANEEGIADFFIASGYRDLERQGELFDAAEDASLVKPAGYSEHHTGLAIDIGIPGVPLLEMEGLPEVLWLAETAWEYGFILRYPEGLYAITGIAFEPWHFRYVGRLHAFYMHRNGLVLEQYLDRLTDRGILAITMEGRRYEVWHQIPYNGMIYVPEHLPFSVSSDNMGGWIVTVEIG